MGTNTYFARLFKTPEMYSAESPGHLHPMNAAMMIMMRISSLELSRTVSVSTTTDIHIPFYKVLQTTMDDL